MLAEDLHKSKEDTGVEGGMVEEKGVNKNRKEIRGGNGGCNYNIFYALFNYQNSKNECGGIHT